MVVRYCGNGKHDTLRMSRNKRANRNWYRNYLTKYRCNKVAGAYCMYFQLSYHSYLSRCQCGLRSFTSTPIKRPKWNRPNSSHSWQSTLCQSSIISLFYWVSSKIKFWGGSEKYSICHRALVRLWKLFTSKQEKYIYSYISSCVSKVVV